MPHRLVVTAAVAAFSATLATMLAGCASNAVTATAGDSTALTTVGTGTVSGGSGGRAGNAEGVQTTTSTAPTTASSPTTATKAPSATFTPAPTTPGLLPETSECNPGSNTLPDGLYFGYVSDALDDSIQFDLACWFTGEPAVKAAAQDGAESPPPNDYYIRNASRTLRGVTVGPKIDVIWLPNVAKPATAPTSYQQWVIDRSPVFGPPVWITIKGGVLTRIVEQYLP